MATPWTNTTGQKYNYPGVYNNADNFTDPNLEENPSTIEAALLKLTFLRDKLTHTLIKNKYIPAFTQSSTKEVPGTTLTELIDILNLKQTTGTAPTPGNYEVVEGRPLYKVEINKHEGEEGPSYTVKALEFTKGFYPDFTVTAYMKDLNNNTDQVIDYSGLSADTIATEVTNYLTTNQTATEVPIAASDQNVDFFSEVTIPVVALGATFAGGAVSGQNLIITSPSNGWVPTSRNFQVEVPSTKITTGTNGLVPNTFYYVDSSLTATVVGGDSNTATYVKYGNASTGLKSLDVTYYADSTAQSQLSGNFTISDGVKVDVPYLSQLSGFTPAYDSTKQKYVFNGSVTSGQEGWVSSGNLSIDIANTSIISNLKQKSPAATANSEIQVLDTSKIKDVINDILSI